MADAQVVTTTAACGRDGNYNLNPWADRALIIVFHDVGTLYDLVKMFISDTVQ